MILDFCSLQGFLEQPLLQLRSHHGYERCWSLKKILTTRIYDQLNVTLNDLFKFPENLQASIMFHFKYYLLFATISSNIWQSMRLPCFTPLSGTDCYLIVLILINFRYTLKGKSISENHRRLQAITVEKISSWIMPRISYLVFVVLSYWVRFMWTEIFRAEMNITRTSQKATKRFQSWNKRSFKTKANKTRHTVPGLNVVKSCQEVPNKF